LSFSPGSAAFALGRDIGGRNIIGNIEKLPHVLIAGTTGSGKSVCTNSLIISLLYKSTPDEVRFIMVDPKMVELAPYNGIPHLLIPVVTDPKKAAGALQWAVFEMMKRYKTFSENGVKKLEEAYNFVRSLGEKGETILFVGTKKQAQEAIKEEATRCGQYYVNARWLGGMMTNFKTMRTRVDRLNQLKRMQEDGTFDMLPKKEVMKHMGEIAKLEKYLGGVTEMKKLPGALFVVDPRKERNAINEARKLHIPIVAIVDTNCDPDEIDYVIPGNDDAIRAIKLIASVMANAMLEGKQGEQMDEAAEAPAAE